MDFGLQAGIPDTAKVIAAVKTPASNSAVNFAGPVTPVFNVKSLTASVSLVAFSQAKLAFGAEITNVGKADIAVTLLIPKVSALLTAAYGTSFAQIHVVDMIACADRKPDLSSSQRLLHHHAGIIQDRREADQSSRC